jgi:uncharacterized cupredoxin-like copper-binding protein
MTVWLRTTVIALAMAVAPTTLLAQSPTAPDADWSDAQLINVLMIDDQFVPDRLSLRHGIPYQFHLENHGTEPHEFTAPEFFADAMLQDPGVLTNGGRTVVLQPGFGVDINLMPLKPGTYRLICADHEWDGMTGEIVVE